MGRRRFEMNSEGPYGTSVGSNSGTGMSTTLMSFPSLSKVNSHDLVC